MPRLLLLFTCLIALPAWAQFKNQTPAGEAPGPWLFATIGVGQDAEKQPLTTALKGLAIKVGAQAEAGICYDLDLGRAAGGWTGGKFVTPVNLMSRGEYPTARATPEFLTAETLGFAVEMPGAWHDSRPEPFGPLPELRYRGLFVHGNRVVLKWRLGETEILESPWFEQRGVLGIFSRTFQVSASRQPLEIVVCRLPEGIAPPETVEGVTFFGAGLNAPLIERAGFTRWVTGGKVIVATDYELPAGATWRQTGGQLLVRLPPSEVPRRFRVLFGTGPETADTLPPFTAEPPLEDLPAWTKGGPAHWPETATTQGEVSTAAEPYVVDTVRLPDPNPWSAPMFLGGFDFFPDGRAAVCTFHGDVFIVSGLDGKLDRVTWKRFATGLYHPLGLKIVRGEIYVTGRDGLTRLRDLNGDGEADFYEVFNWDIEVTKSFHEFVFDLQTDPDGNFYFAKAGPVKNGGRGFDRIAAHHGCVLRVTPDGQTMSVFATGFRAPNGLGAGPHGEITTGDNEGTWTPVCRINWLHPGGFYGVPDLSHWTKPPQDYDRPLCWLPKRVDNSSGSQVWAPEKGWGPWSGHLLHLSYGQCALFGVLMQEVELPDAPDCCDRQPQGGVTRFPLKFESGLMRARFGPHDGQLYVAGLRGWQTTALKNGCLQRVRYTGAATPMPIELQARKEGIEIQFACSLDTQQACDPENWTVEVWNYLWSSAYGSPEISTLTPPAKPVEPGKNGELEFSPAQMKQSHHDPLTVQRVTMGTDDRTVFLEIPGLKPVMQMSIKYQLRTAEGQELNGEVVNTIHALPAAGER